MHLCLFGLLAWQGAVAPCRLGGCRGARFPTRRPRPECKPHVHVPVLQIGDLSAAHDGGMPPDVPSISGASAAPAPAPRLVWQQELW